MFLRRLFPRLFNYFDTLSPGFKHIPDESDTTGIKRIEYSLPYALLHKEYRKYTIVDDTHPVGTRYKEFLSGDGNNSGFRNKGIFIGEYACSIVSPGTLIERWLPVTKAPVPQELLNQWFAPSSAPLLPINLAVSAGGKRRRSGEWTTNWFNCWSLN